MGYKLAGYNHLGGVEIDPQVADVYKLNHNPKYLFVDDIREFADRSDYPQELYNLDILDGSPPCSSFSMAGNREKDWGIRRGGVNVTRDENEGVKLVNVLIVVHHHFAIYNPNDSISRVVL